MSKTTASDVKKARVTIEIGDEEYTLIPSPEAIISLSGAYDGFAPLIAAIGRLNHKAVADTICAGLGLEGSKAREMAKQIAVHGILELSPKAAEFASILANGGRALTPETSGKEEGGNRPL
jgi:hypothetical protein